MKQILKVKSTPVSAGGNNNILVSNVPVGSVIAYDGDIIPAGYEEVEDYEPTYSLEEKRIGTWINGKPLYRKVVEYTLTRPTEYPSYPSFDTGIRDLEFATLNIYQSDGPDNNSYFRFPQNIAGYLERTTGRYHFILVDANSGAVSGLYTFVIHYTKTTD